MLEWCYKPSILSNTKCKLKGAITIDIRILCINLIKNVLLTLVRKRLVTHLADIFCVFTDNFIGQEGIDLLI